MITVNRYARIAIVTTMILVVVCLGWVFSSMIGRVNYDISEIAGTSESESEVQVSSHYEAYHRALEILQDMETDGLDAATIALKKAMIILDNSPFSSTLAGSNYEVKQTDDGYTVMFLAKGYDLYCEFTGEDVELYSITLDREFSVGEMVYLRYFGVCREVHSDAYYAVYFG